MTTIKELVTSWGFVVDDKALKGLDDKLEKLQTSVKWVGGLAVGAAGALFGLAKSTADAGDNAAKSAQKLGVNVEALQEMRYAADLAGVGAEGFDDSLRFMQKGLADAKKGTGESRDAFFALSKVLGRDITKSGKPAEEMILDVADAMSQLTDSSKKIAIAQTLFGRAGTNLIPLLSQGSKAIKEQRQEARDLGLVMSEEATAASEEFNDSLTRAKGALTGLRNIVGVRLLPVIQKLVLGFKDWVVANRAVLATRIGDAIKLLTEYCENAVAVFARIAKSVNLIVVGFGGWERVARFVGIAMLAIMSLRLVSFIGGLIISLGKAVWAFRLLGNEGLLAQIKLAAIPLAIGAAFVALLLIIEDVVAYFQGRKSVTGAMVKNFDGLADGLFKKFDEWKDKAVAFAKSVAESFTGFLLDLKPEDFKKFGDIILKALSLALITSGLAIELGLAVGKAIFDGIEKAMREKSPMLASLIFGEDVAKNTKLNAIKAMREAGKSTDEINAELQKIDAEQKKGIGGVIAKSGDAVLKFFGLDLNAEAAKARDRAAVDDKMNTAQASGFPDIGAVSARLNEFKPTAAPGAVPTPSPSVINNLNTSSANTNAPTSIRVDAPITVNVPAGTPPELVAGAAQAGVKDSLDSLFRETGRAVAPAVSY